MEVSGELHTQGCFNPRDITTNKVKSKGKVSVGIITHQAMKAYVGVKVYLHTFLN
jgi:hypothetical protein